MRYRKILIFISFLLVLVIAFVGCGSGGGGHKVSLSPVTFPLTGLQDKNTYILLNIANKTEGDVRFGANSLTININSASTAASQNLPLNTQIIGRYNSCFGANQAKIDSIFRSRGNKDIQQRLSLSRFEMKALPTPPTEGVTQRQFYIVTDDAGDLSMHTFTCKKVSTHSYIWVDNEDLSSGKMSGTNIDDYASAFETIYQTDTTTFGSDTNSDQETPIYILISSVLNEICGGYFNPDDKHTVSGSNNHDMIYLANYSNEDDGIPYNKATLAHEFQHMINYDCHYRNHAASTESVWLDEAMAELASYICGYGNNTTNYDKIASFLQYPVGVTVWTQYTESYGAGILFGNYIKDKYTSGILKTIVDTNLVGIKNIESATGKDFNQLMQDFFLTLCFSNTSFGSSSTNPDSTKYQFSTLNIRSHGASGLRPLPNVLSIGMSGYISGVYPYMPLLIQVSGQDANSSITASVSDGSVIGGTVISLDKPNVF
jgi:hypothetical protein